MVVTKEQEKRINKILKDRAPSTRKRSSQYIFWEDIGTKLGQPFNFTNIPISKLYEMKRDPTIAFAMHYARVPILSAPWRIEGNNPQVNAFIENSLKEIYASFVLDYLNSWDFGYQAEVKRFKKIIPEWTYVDPKNPEAGEQRVWDYGNIEAIVWDKFVPLPPEMVDPDWNAKGDFNGIIYNGNPGEGMFPFEVKSDDKVRIPLDSCLWITNEKESVFGSLWGYPRLGYSYPFWWSYWFRWALADRAFEKGVDPTIITRFPDEPIYDDAGNEIDPRELAFALGEAARANDTVALPSTLIQDDGSEGRSTNTPQWDLETLSYDINFDALSSSFDQLEILKIQSVWVPEHALTSGQGAQSARNVASEMTSSLKESQAVTMAEIDEHINKYMIPQLIELNFPELKNVTCKKVTTGFSSNGEELARTIVQLYGQADPNNLDVDIRRVLEESGVPMLTQEQINEKERKALEEAQAMAEIQNQPADDPFIVEDNTINGIPGKDSGASSVWGSKTGKDTVDFEDIKETLASNDIKFELIDTSTTGIASFYEDGTLYLDETLNDVDLAETSRKMLKLILDED